MIAKKSKQADLERKRFAFFQIGLVVAGAATLLAFEYKSVTVEDKKVVVQETAPAWIAPTDIEIPDDILDSRPQPQRTSLQTEPDEDVVISTRPSDAGKTFTSIIVVGDPCEGCEEDLRIVEDPKAGPILDISEVDPAFPGGYPAMMKYIQDELVVPQICRDMNEGGMVYVEFVVNTDGSITQVKCVNEVNPALMKEAVRVVGAMPRWTPGENAGKKVRVRFTIPINVIVQ
jgi:protein TonB